MSEAVNGFLLKLSLLLFVVLAGTYAFTASQYEHPMPEQDCTQPNDYPVCSVAQLPVVQPETPLVLLLLGSAVGGALILLITVVSYLATIRPQGNAFQPEHPEEEKAAEGPSKVSEVFP